MRKNNVLLAAAMTATLVMPMTSAYAGLANFYSTGGCLPNNVASNCSTVMPAIQLGNSPYNVVPIPPASNKTPGILYATHLFGNPGKVVLPAKAGEYAVAEWVIEGTPSGEIQVTASLTGAEFAADTTTSTSKAVWLQYAANPLNPLPLPAGIPIIKGLNNSIQGDCVKPTECTWLLTGLANSNLSTGDKLYFIYKITNAAGLGTDGGEVKLAVKLGTVFNDSIMGNDTITIATGKEPFTINFRPTNNTDIRVSAEDLKSFLTKKSVPDPELPTSYDATFGYLLFNDYSAANGIKTDDGYTNWVIPNSATIPDIFKASATLTIKDGGQFAASLKGSKGQVSLLDASGTTIAAAATVEATDATWNLTEVELGKITAAAVALKGEIPIVIKADGTSLINTTPDDLPQAHLTLSYTADNNKKALNYPKGPNGDETDVTVALTKYKINGVVCQSFGIVPPGGQDQVTVRITNDSTAVGQVKGTLYGLDGKPVGDTKVLAEQIGKLQTIYLDSEKIFDIFGTWVGRGRLDIVATVPKIEVLTLLRPLIPACPACGAGKPLENHSMGVTGSSCRN